MLNVAGAQETLFTSGTCLTTGEQGRCCVSGKRGPGRPQRGQLPLADVLAGSPVNVLAGSLAVGGPAGVVRARTYHWRSTGPIRQRYYKYHWRTSDMFASGNLGLPLQLFRGGARTDA